jgi:hypothetical protein
MKDFFQLDLIELNPQPYFIKGKTRLSYDRKNALVTMKRAGGYLRRFDRKGLIDFIRNNPSARIPVFPKKYLYPRGGARDLQSVLEKKVAISGIETKLNSHILEIRKKGELWELTAADGEVLETKSICLTSTSSIQHFYYEDKSFEITHRLVNYSHYHLVIKGALLKPCSYIRVLGNEIIHRLCDITYQLENEVESDEKMLLVGFFDDESTTNSEEVILSNIKQFLIENKFVNSDVEITYAQKNRFTTSYIPNELREELNDLDDSIELLHTTDLMYGIHYKLEEWGAVD